MEASMLFGGLSAALAFGTGLSAVYAYGAAPRRRDVVASARGEDAPRAGRLAWRLRNGFGPLLPVAEALLRLARVERVANEAVQELARRRFITTERALLSVAVAGVMALAAVAFVVSRSLVGAVAVAGCAVAASVVALNATGDKRRDAVRDAVPDVLRSLSACFDAGLTLMQTFGQVASETKGPLHMPFARAAHVLETGGSASEALEELRRGTSVPELAFVAVALDVQHQAGGSLHQVLEAARDTVEGELALRRSLKVQTAQAKLSARIVSLMPFVLVAVFSLVSEDFLAPFFESAAGWALLAVALAMQAAGVLLVRRMLAVGAES